MTERKEADMTYSIGDDLVHAHYGVGKIVDIEDKELFGKTTTYYVVKTKDSTFWMPIAKADNDRTRPVVSSQTIQNKVIEALEEKPREMSSHYKARRKFIKEVNASGKIVRVAKLVRDLTYRKAKKGSLTTLEDKDLEYFKNRLINEWARSVGKPKQKIQAKIQKILQQHLEPTS